MTNLSAEKPDPDSANRTALIVEQFLGVGGGHFLNFVSGIEANLSAEGTQVTILANTRWRGRIGQATVVPQFRRTHAFRFVQFTSKVGRLLGCVLHNLALFFQVSKVLRQRGRQDVVISTYTNVFHLLGWRLVWWVWGNRRVGRMVLNCPCPVWVCDFDPEGNKRYHSALWFSRWVHARFAGPIKRGQVVLATETEHEARELTQLVGAPVQWFNPPRPSEMVEAARSIRAGRVSAEDPFVFLWVGRLALEKGVREFMAGVARCLTENPAMPCRIWVPEPRDWQKAEISREEFAAWMGRDPRIEFAPSPASPEEDNYANLLGRADCVLLPYQRQHYIGRVSSTALDAGVTDLPVVVTAGTWMEDILGQLCSGVAVPDGDAAALAGAMADTWRQRAEAATDARRVGEVARRELSWSRFMGFVRDARAA